MPVTTALLQELSMTNRSSRTTPPSARQKHGSENSDSHEQDEAY